MIETGTLMAGRYQILEKIGTGGMSDVYKALDTSLGREIALKVLKDEYVTDMDFVSKFRQEAKAAAGLEHPNIVNVYDVGNENGNYFIVMEYVEGITLKTYIAKKGVLSYNELLSIAIQVGRGIEAAHNKKIIHRDIKPQNIIISKEGKVKVTDFGIARAVTSNTINADRMGSVHYSSPEQARNGFVTYQSDIYSLGIMMYEMATGRVPFDGDSTVAVAILHLQSEMVPPSQIVPDVPISVEKIILKATMKNPERRYKNMSEMLVDLKKAMVNPNEDFVVIPQAAPVQEESVSITPAPVVTTESVVETVKEQLKRTPEPEDEDDDDDDEARTGLDRAITIMGIAAAIIIVLIVVYLVGSFLGLFHFGKRGSGEETTTSSSIEGEMQTVPSVLGYTEDEARKAIEKAGFVYKKLGESSSETYDEGLVIEQSVDGGQQAPAGSTIEIMVSSGKGNKDIPDVVGLTQQDAISRIEGNGFVCKTEAEFDDSVEQGRVIRQSPSSNEKAKENDVITIWISRGNEMINIPNVMEKSQSVATSELTAAGFNVKVENDSSDTIPKGYVISQSASGQAQKGTDITITVSTGADTTFYKVVLTYNPVDDMETYIVLRDENGTVLDQRIVREPVTISASHIRTATGTLHYYSGMDMSSEVAPAEIVNFELQ